MISNKMAIKFFPNSNFLVFLGIRFDTHQYIAKSNFWQFIAWAISISNEILLVNVYSSNVNIDIDCFKNGNLNIENPIHLYPRMVTRFDRSFRSIKIFRPEKDKNPDLIYYFEPLSGWFSKIYLSEFRRTIR